MSHPRSPQAAAALRAPRLPRRLLAGAALLLVVAACLLGAATALAQQNAAGALYAANGCHQCHGYEGQGGVAGPRIAPSPYPYAAFAQLVRRPAGEMPAYAAVVLRETDLRAIYDYVRAIPEPPAAEDLSALR